MDQSPFLWPMCQFLRYYTAVLITSFAACSEIRYHDASNFISFVYFVKIYFGFSGSFVASYINISEFLFL